MKTKAIIAAFTFLLSIYSCGGGNTEGELDSVIVYASVDPSEVQADIIKWQDIDGNGICDTYFISPEQVNLVIKVTPNPYLPNTITPSPVEVEKVKLVYTPMSTNAIALQQKERIIGRTVEPNGEQTIPVFVVDDNQADYLKNFITSPMEYYVTIHVTVREIYSGNREDIATGLNLSVGDFTTADENCTPPQ